MNKPHTKRELMLKNFKRAQEGKELIKFEESLSIDQDLAEGSSVSSMDHIGKQSKFRWSSHVLVEKMESKELEGHVLRMLAQASANYDLIIGKEMLKAFESTNLDYKTFRIFNKNILNIEYTDEEFGLACSFFDIANTRATVDGMEFLKCFVLLKAIYSGAAHARLREREADYVEKMREKERLRVEELEKKFFITPSYDSITPASEAYAFEKLTIAAARYEKNHPSSMGLHGFGVKELKAGEFRELVRQTFNLAFDSRELGVMVKHFGDVETSSINCNQFIQKFLKIGFDERNKAKLQQLEACRLAEEHNKRYGEELIIAANNKMEVGVSSNFLPERDQVSALEKIRVASTKYRKDHPSSVGLDGFNGQYLTPGQFREMLKRTFNVTVTHEELSALVYAFDADENGKVKCSQFLLYFSKVGLMERSKEHLETLEKQRRQQQQQADEEAKKLEDQWGKMELTDEQLGCYNADHMENAMSKLRYAARWYDKSSESGISLKGFVGAHMSPATFREMCKRCLQIKLTVQELAALVFVYKLKDTNASGLPPQSKIITPLRTGNASPSLEDGEFGSPPDTANSNENMFILEGSVDSLFANGSTLGKGVLVDLEMFRLKFGIMSFEEKEKMRTEQREKKFHAMKKLELMEEERQKKELAYSLGKNEIDYEFSKEDYDHGMSKLHHAAASFNHNSVGLNGFNVSHMQPKVLRDMVRRTFKIVLFPKELGAIVSTEDMKLDDGLINVEAFIALFLALKRQHRNEERLKDLAQEKATLAAKETEEAVRLAKRKLEETTKLAHAKEDEVSLMKKLKRVAQMYTIDSGNYNERLTCFKGPPITAAAFRTLFNSTFRTKLAHAEAGLLMNITDPVLAKSCMIDGSKFLLGFFKLARLQEKVLLGIIDEGTIDLSIFYADKIAPVTNISINNHKNDNYNSNASSSEKSMLGSLLGGVNPWVDWDIGRNAYFQAVPQLHVNTRSKERGNTAAINPAMNDKELNGSGLHVTFPSPIRQRTVSPLRAITSHKQKRVHLEKIDVTRGPQQNISFAVLARPTSAKNSMDFRHARLMQEQTRTNQSM